MGVFISGRPRIPKSGRYAATAAGSDVARQRSILNWRHAGPRRSPSMTASTFARRASSPSANTFIASTLFEHGERTPARRGGRSRDEHALRGAFETFFPGAPWVADGKLLEVLIDGEVSRVKLELAVDAATAPASGSR